MAEDSFSSRVRLKDFDAGKGLERGAGKFKEGSWYFVKMLFFLTAIPYPNALKIFFLKIYGARVGKKVNIKPRVNLHMPWKLEIGDYSWIGEEVFILNFESVKIGENVCISQRAFLCGGNHDYTDPAFKYRNGPITIQSGTWVGAGCFIGPGVTIGVDCVVAAGSVVTKDLNSNSIYKGNPAEKIKSRWN
ncbi:MAG: lacA 1 [Mucilaginibacter sp.]|nr:lacA 1 [Mucilaginibacter sp.]